ncbi:hypothetical protein [Streptomyces sp. YIM 130001]|nr:hypothetical protein [Streptomyces sp. YIM 130001]
MVESAHEEKVIPGSGARETGALAGRAGVVGVLLRPYVVRQFGADPEHR